MKILFTGYYGFDNFGDDLFGLICFERLKKLQSGSVPIILAPPLYGIDPSYCLVPKKISSLYKSKQIIGQALRAIFMIYGCLRYRQVVLAGGSIIGNSFRMLTIQYVCAKFGFCRLSAIGVSVGPFLDEKNKKIAKLYLDRLTYLSVRDKASLKEVENLHVSVKANLYNDLAGCAEFPKSKTKKSNIIGVSICRYDSIKNNSEQEKKRNTAFFDGIIAFSIKYNFTVNVIILNNDKDMGDEYLSKELFFRLSQANVYGEIIEYKNPIETIKHISACDIYFSVRLHGAIVAYLLEIPFILVEYHDKCKDFLDYIGFDEKNRILKNVDDAKKVTDGLEEIFNKGMVCSMKPSEYIKKSKSIFTESPWA